MKKLYFVAVLTLLLASCGSKSVQSEDDDPIVDSLSLVVMHDILDSTLSIEDIKIEYRQLLDTIYKDASTCPDEYYRIGAKSFAIELLGMTLEGPHTTSEDIKFTIDSLLPRFQDIRDCWYEDGPWYGTDSTVFYCLSQNFVRSTSNGLKTVSVVLYIYDSERSGAVVTFPKDVKGAPYIAFTNEDFSIADKEHLFGIDKAYRIDTLENESIQIIFDETFVPQMLAHDGMIAGYWSNDEALSEKDQLIAIMGGLDHFHGKYKEVIELLSNNF